MKDQIGRNGVDGSLRSPSIETRNPLEEDNIEFKKYNVKATEKKPSGLHLDDVDSSDTLNNHNESRIRKITKAVADAGYLSLDIAKRSMFDFCDSTLECFKSVRLAGANGAKEAITETAKKVSGGLALAAVLAQLSTAKMTGLAESITGYNIPDSSVNAITQMLKLSGVQLHGMSKQELADLSVSFLRILRGHDTDLSLEKSVLSTKMGDLTVNISDVNLKNIRASHDAKTDSDSAFVEADELQFSLEMHSPDKPPDKLIVKMNDLKLEGGSNLFALLGNAVAEVIVSISNSNQPLQDSNGMNEVLPVFTQVGSEQPKDAKIKSFAHVDAKGIGIYVESTGELCQSYGLSKDTDVSFNGVHVSKEFNNPEANTGVNVDAFSMSNIAVDSSSTITNASITLDDDLNGKFVSDIKLDYTTFNKIFPKRMPKKLKKYIVQQKGSEGESHFINLRLATDISNGVIDIDTLIGSSATSEEQNRAQKYISKVVLACLRSKKTLIAKTDSDTRLMVNVPIIVTSDPEYGKEKKSKMKYMKQRIVRRLANPMQYNTFFPLAESYAKYFEANPDGRGKISLIGMLEDQGYTMENK